jgi:hypothetical protein
LPTARRLEVAKSEEEHHTTIGKQAEAIKHRGRTDVIE